MKVLFTGIQPTGLLHIGNYFGAMRPAIELQEGGDAFYLPGQGAKDVHFRRRKAARLVVLYVKHAQHLVDHRLPHQRPPLQAQRVL